MATTLQQLLDAATAQVTDLQTPVDVADTTRALSHLGRALTRLADDGFTSAPTERQWTTAALGQACSSAGDLWPHGRGPLTDRAGAIADLLGRGREQMGRAQRWTMAVQLARLAGAYAQRSDQLLPLAGLAPLAAVRQLADTVERHAHAHPPAFAGAALLDRLVPMPAATQGSPLPSTPDAVAALTASLDRAQRSGEVTLRGFRAASAAAEVAAIHAAVLTAAVHGSRGDAAARDAEVLGPSTASVAWRSVGQASMTFHDGFEGTPPQPQGVVASARILAEVLRADAVTLAKATVLGGEADRDALVRPTQFVANQLPLLAEQLSVAVQGWARSGHLFASARHLPRMEDMPLDRVRDTIAGRHVRVHGADLDRLADALARAATLSAALADRLNRAAPPVQRTLAAGYAQAVKDAPGAGRTLGPSAADRPGRPALRVVRSERDSRPRRGI